MKELKTKKTKKYKKNYPRITIERVIMNDEGHITALDIHDEKFGDAIFFGEGHAHFHGFMNGGKCKDI